MFPVTPPSGQTWHDHTAQFVLHYVSVLVDIFTHAQLACMVHYKFQAASPEQMLNLMSSSIALPYMDMENIIWHSGSEKSTVHPYWGV